jgi:PAS domain S-box-containing protein
MLSQDVMRHAIEASPSGVLIADAEGRIEFVNARFEAIFGYSRLDVLGQPVEMLVPKRVRKNHPELRASFMADPEPRPMGQGRDVTGVSKDGRLIPLEIGLTTFEAEDGMHVIASVVDISARKRAERLVQIAVEAAPNGMVMVNAGGAMVMVNSKFEEIFGYRREELYGERIEMLVPAESRGRHPSLFAGFIANPTARAMGAGRDLKGVCKDGREIGIEIGLTPIHTEEGLHVMASVVDITERKRSEEALLESERQYRKLLESAPEAIFLQANERFIYLNSAAVSMFGARNADELLGHSIWDRIRPSMRQTVRDRIDAIVGQQHGVEPNEEVWLRLNGSEFTVEVSAVPTQFGGQECALVFAHETTERRRQERALKLYAQSLERTNKDLDDFAYIASHDLQSPLRAIAGLADWVLEDAGDRLPEEAARNLELMHGRIQRMQRLLKDLLEYSRAGRVQGEREEVDTRTLVQGIVELLDVPKKFAITIAPDMPALTTLVTPLETCLRNLISNAIKHHDRPDGTIHIGAEDRLSCVVFSVTDDGPGIASEYHERIFGMFQTLQPRDDLDASGVGLSIIRKTAESYGGTVSVESEEGKGATFRLTWEKYIPEENPYDI